jgi:hypothetical protein
MTNITGPWWGITTPEIKFQQILQLQDGTFAAISFNSYQIMLAKTMDKSSIYYKLWVKADTAPQLLNINTNLLSALNDKPNGNIQFNNILQLQNGTFAAINKSSNQIITSNTLVNDYTTWVRADGTSLSGPADTGNGNIQFSQITQLQNGTFAALEFVSNQVYISSVLSNNTSTWSIINTGDLQFSQILQAPNVPSSVITNYPWNIKVYNYSPITLVSDILPTYFSDEYNTTQIFPVGSGTSTTPTTNNTLRANFSSRPFPGTLIKLNYYANNNTGTNTYENVNFRQTNTINISNFLTVPAGPNGISGATINIYVRNDNSGNVVLSNS